MLLSTSEIRPVFVETLDKCFENVCELDLIFHSDKVGHTSLLPASTYYLFNFVVFRQAPTLTVTLILTLTLTLTLALILN